jgi:cell wall assembly regulator SMI1
LEQWLKKHRLRYAQGLRPGVTASDLDALKALGAPVPDSLRLLLGWHNGQSDDFVGHFEQDWDLMNVAHIIATKKELDAGDRASTGWQTAWIPFLNDDADDYVCLDTSQPGAPVRAFWQGKTDHPAIAPSLAGWLDDFVNALEHGEYHEDHERGSFLRVRGSEDVNREVFMPLRPRPN